MTADRLLANTEQFGDLVGCPPQSQKSSLPQAAKSVSRVLMSDTNPAERMIASGYLRRLTDSLTTVRADAPALRLCARTVRHTDLSSGSPCAIFSAFWRSCGGDDD